VTLEAALSQPCRHHAARPRSPRLDPTPRPARTHHQRLHDIPRPALSAEVQKLNVNVREGTGSRQRVLSDLLEIEWGDTNRHPRVADTKRLFRCRWVC
jgi:hypothetical protein